MQVTLEISSLTVSPGFFLTTVTITLVAITKCGNHLNNRPLNLAKSTTCL